MSATAVLLTVIAYFAAMMVVSWLSGRGNDNAGFFTGARKSKWWVVAFAMIGSTMSGVTYVSVPGMVGVSGFGYLQMCLGFFVGYLVIAFVLTWFFFISKMLGASVRLFLVCLTLQLLVFDPFGLPFWLNVVVSMLIVLAYTFRGGVKSVISGDTLKTFCMIVSVVLCIVFIARDLGLDGHGILSTIGDSGLSRVFWFDDVNHPQFFWKQFLGGLFTVIAMTGLDQDLMQRTLACKNVRDSQKNLVVSVILQIVVIAMFLSLGVLLSVFAAHNGITETGDKLFPAVATSGLLPPVVGVLFIIGLVSCAYSAGGSALTSLTTSFTIDIIGTAGKSDAQVTSVRKKVHIAMAVLMGVTIVVFNLLNNTSAIDAVYKLASYTYGPLLGMFAFGILTRWKVPCGLPGPAALPGAATELRALVRRLQIQLRIAPAQRRLHLPRPLPSAPACLTGCGIDSEKMVGKFCRIVKYIYFCSPKWEGSLFKRVH